MARMIYDLHSHTTASDGSLSPTDLISRAVEKGVDVLAVTDHDGTEGLKEAAQAATEQGLAFVPGVEISVTWAGHVVHIVGLNIDVDDEILQQGLANLRTERFSRAEEIARRLDKAGIPGALEGAREYASDVMLGRLHFARFLVAAGKAKDIRDVFKKYLVHNKPGYVAGEWASLEAAVGWITAAGGQAVIAHPARYKMTATKRRKLVEEFKAAGGVALEVVSGKQDLEEVRTLAALAEKYDLLASCGSDFHSPTQTWLDLGQLTPFPDNCTPIWSVWS